MSPEEFRSSLMDLLREAKGHGFRLATSDNDNWSLWILRGDQVVTQIDVEEVRDCFES